MGFPNQPIPNDVYESIVSITETETFFKILKNSNFEEAINEEIDRPTLLKNILFDDESMNPLDKFQMFSIINLALDLYDENVLVKGQNNEYEINYEHFLQMVNRLGIETKSDIDEDLSLFE